MHTGKPAVLGSESGLYKLIMRSDKPEARAFQDWVTREVLPAIRKTGSYVLQGADRSTVAESSVSEMPDVPGLVVSVNLLVWRSYSPLRANYPRQ
ncbi:BRO-N domain-containing protein [Chelatococcus asaccharovorans]|uniref:BRO family protein n=1 Tax=Chelatococcus asaccharovorans TaxID=28210 RepID=A0A2V3TY57_9HYPH|nr:hypothetical protein [Chelatococcus asaccharovorans]PXW53686.1 BRO family protein [Chelatococcus asaccharovorans]